MSSSRPGPILSSHIAKEAEANSPPKRPLEKGKGGWTLNKVVVGKVGGHQKMFLANCLSRKLVGRGASLSSPPQRGEAEEERRRGNEY